MPWCVAVRSTVLHIEKGDWKGDRMDLDELEEMLRDGESPPVGHVLMLVEECQRWRASTLAYIAAEEAWALVQGRGSGPEYERAKEAGYRATELRDIARAATTKP